MYDIAFQAKHVVCYCMYTCTIPGAHLFFMQEKRGPSPDVLLNLSFLFFFCFRTRKVFSLYLEYPLPQNTLGV